MRATTASASACRYELFKWRFKLSEEYQTKMQVDDALNNCLYLKCFISC